MRLALLTLVVVGGCFSPRVPGYVPCASVAAAGERCPSGQACVTWAGGEDVCVPEGESVGDARGPADVGFDAPSDAQVDAAIDAGSDAPPLTWVAIETIIVPASGTVMTSNTTLVAGTTYHLRASGTCVIISGSGAQSDAEYWDFNPPMDNSQGVDHGLAIDDTVVDDIKLPDWGPYTASHIYEVPWVGAGGPIRAMLYDGVYTNNSGSLTLTILALQ